MNRFQQMIVRVLQQNVNRITSVISAFFTLRTDNSSNVDHRIAATIYREKKGLKFDLYHFFNVQGNILKWKIKYLWSCFSPCCPVPCFAWFRRLLCFAKQYITIPRTGTEPFVRSGKTNSDPEMYQISLELYLKCLKHVGNFGRFQPQTV